MAFVGGPRQVGKTTFALSLLGEGHDESSPAYLSWDAQAGCLLARTAWSSMRSTSTPGGVDS
jgi:hypothetical protein